MELLPTEAKYYQQKVFFCLLDALEHHPLRLELRVKTEIGRKMK